MNKELWISNKSNSSFEPKLYIITRDDLPVNYQIPQVAHSVSEFHIQYEKEYNEWSKKSNSLICLSVKNEKELFNLIDKKLNKNNIKYTVFREPDIGYEITSIAIVPNIQNKKLLSNLPLAGKDLTKEEEKKAWLKKRFDLVDKMENCQQSKGLNILDHGFMCYSKFIQLYNNLMYDEPLNTNEEEWFIPSWFNDHKEYIKKNLYDLYTIEKYLICHDVGKFYCKTIDNEGKIHYPNHAEESYRLAKEYLPELNEKSYDLIKLDMTIHTAKSDSIDYLASLPELSTLLIAGLAEIHANMSMFGGSDSTSFKIKYNNITRIGKKVLGKVDAIK